MVGFRVAVVPIVAFLILINQQVARGQKQVADDQEIQSGQPDACSMVRCKSGTICRVVANGGAQCQATKQAPITFTPSIRPVNRRCPNTCLAVYQPVCGSNGKTYSNECHLRIAVCNGLPVSKVANGECPPTKTTSPSSPQVDEPNCQMLCTADYSPVCGSDGVTYPNACNLQVAACYNRDVKQVHVGECTKGQC